MDKDLKELIDGLGEKLGVTGTALFAALVRQTKAEAVVGAALGLCALVAVAIVAPLVFSWLPSGATAVPGEFGKTDWAPFSPGWLVFIRLAFGAICAIFVGGALSSIGQSVVAFVAPEGCVWEWLISQARGGSE